MFRATPKNASRQRSNRSIQVMLPPPSPSFVSLFFNFSTEIRDNNEFSVGNKPGQLIIHNTIIIF